MAKLGYLALTKQQFDDRIANFYTFQTGIGMNIMLMTVISFIVGLSISGQTFYTFVLGEPRQVRGAEGDRGAGPRAGLHDPVPGGFHRADRLRLRRRSVRRW